MTAPFDARLRDSVWTAEGSLPRDYVGGVAVNEVIPLTAYRCPGCGFVELYAPPV